MFRCLRTKKYFLRFLILMMGLTAIVAVAKLFLLSDTSEDDDQAKKSLETEGPNRYPRLKQDPVGEVDHEERNLSRPAVDVRNVTSQSHHVFLRNNNYKMKLLTDIDQADINGMWDETLRVSEACAKLKYDSLGPLPKTSVIITFHDTETISWLLHTIHSVVQRTPNELLEEIIVIDDFSSKKDFSQTLDIYLMAVFRDTVRIELYRNTENIGLIRSRLKGSRLARGEVILFMDSHSEVQPGWLEPIVFEIKKNRRTLTQSTIDWMEKKEDVIEWVYSMPRADSVVVYDWHFGFGWHIGIKSTRNVTDPIRIKAVIGAYTAIDRNFFREIGEFDDGMEFWGGENIELPIRVWLFGGQVISIPCSRVGHLESKDGRVYRIPHQRTVERNYKRIAEVWFDEYKKYVYLYYPGLIPVDAGNLTSRLELKARAVHNFSWYLENVFPELGIPDRDSFAWGSIQNVLVPRCLNAANNLEIAGCTYLPNQIFHWSSNFELRRPLQVVKSVFAERLALDQYSWFYGTDIASKWIHWKDGPFIEVKSRKCVEALSETVELRPCNFTQNLGQMWQFEHYTEQYDDMVKNRSKPTNYTNIEDILRKTFESSHFGITPKLNST